MLRAAVFVCILSCAIVEKSLANPADLCQPWICKAPDCRCASTSLGNGMALEKIPQLVMITFDDAVTSLIYDQVMESVGKHKNPDGCDAQATFYVAHEYTDYSKVHELWAQGHEIALHSITHSPYTSYWMNMTNEKVHQEFGDQREMISYFAKIPYEDIVGMRVPLFQLSGDVTYKAMKEIGLTYDSSWPTTAFNNPGLWPYTLDYYSTQDCMLGFCPESSIPGAWVQPILNWIDDSGLPCAMVDACVYVPDHDVDLLLEWMKKNFHRIYKSNRAPFGIHLHAAWFSKGANYFTAFKNFLEYLTTLEDVFVVQTAKVVEYTKNPVPLEDFNSCPKLNRPSCTPRACRLDKPIGSTVEERYLTSCTACPSIYPWLGNPFGDAKEDGFFYETS